jgi:hypothetical protein
MLRWTAPWAVGSLPESGRPPDDPGKRTTCSFNSNARGENSAAEGLERTFCFRDQKNRDHAVPLYGEMAGATRSTRSRVVILRYGTLLAGFRSEAVNRNRHHLRRWDHGQHHR